MWVEGTRLVAVNVSREIALFSIRTIYDLKPLHLGGSNVGNNRYIEITDESKNVSS